ncbi:hypothetical protein CBF87_08625 [Limosilactobacillus reuteri]|uniref:helix-turn-helix domain-containing protein n=1 Tax=Limosilactobacillus reuteri TaxID=1598 RepID=UPI000BD89E57|nr:helix-turn-helix transcriptional regulator [Limosilactobacillus reuteri]OYS45570.1 hypothetical protein CBF87_08625 [Limosilactobacillus reuteri]OYS52695.1 hypothetical protein CBF81_06505 [Limosilactobacillus reuteri]
MNKLYLRIKDLAAQRKVSLAKVERDLGFSNGIISTWKNGKASQDKINALADYFDVTTDYLLGRANTPRYVSNDIKNTGLFRKAVKDNELSGSEQESLAEDMNEYLKFRAELLRKKRG